MTSHGGVAAEQLRAIVERIERLEEEKQAIADDIKDVYAEAKANGYDAKILRQVVRLRKQDSAERSEQEQMLDLYMHALGMTVEERIERVEADTGQMDVESVARKPVEEPAAAIATPPDDGPAPEFVTTTHAERAGKPSRWKPEDGPLLGDGKPDFPDAPECLERNPDGSFKTAAPAEAEPVE